MWNRDRLTDTEDRRVVTKRGTWVVGRDKSADWDERTHTTVRGIDNQQGPTVEHREPYSVFCDKLHEERI